MKKIEFTYTFALLCVYGLSFYNNHELTKQINEQRQHIVALENGMRELESSIISTIDEAESASKQKEQEAVDSIRDMADRFRELTAQEEENRSR